MKTQTIFKTLGLLLAITALFSCGSDDNGNDSVTSDNDAPVIEAQSFNVSEDVASDTTFATVVATDPDGDDLTYSIETNSDDLFNINNNGELSVMSGASLDFDTAGSHTITVAVADAIDTSTATISITVVDVDNNTAPVIAAQSFSVSEDIASDTVFATVVATDPDGDDLTYSVVTNSDDLFNINNSGELSVTAGASLDFDTAESHAITVEVSDAVTTTTAEISIAVIEVEEGAAFITTWETTVADEMITIPTNSAAHTYNYTVDWGDGTMSDNQTGDATHTYAAIGTHTISISGDFPAIYFLAAGDALKIQTIEQWGSIVWESMESAFSGCRNITVAATDAPNLDNVTNMSNMFNSARTLNSDFSSWDTSNVTDMSGMFAGASIFNGDISSWNTISVTDMSGMFNGAEVFNGDISGWNVSAVTTMQGMFFFTRAFNGDISGWNVSAVTTMHTMFLDAEGFNQDISGWNVSSVTDMTQMFREATAFNQDLLGWDVSGVTDMENMFTTATAFNGDISDWNVSSVLRMDAMFSQATAFNQDISGWNVISVTNMRAMFQQATTFNQDLSGWDTSNVSSCTNFDVDSALTPENLPTLGCFM